MTKYYGPPKINISDGQSLIFSFRINFLTLVTVGISYWRLEQLKSHFGSLRKYTLFIIKNKMNTPGFMMGPIQAISYIIILCVCGPYVQCRLQISEMEMGWGTDRGFNVCYDS